MKLRNYFFIFSTFMLLNLTACSQPEKTESRLLLGQLISVESDLQYSEDLLRENSWAYIRGIEYENMKYEKVSPADQSVLDKAIEVNRLTNEVLAKINDCRDYLAVEFGSTADEPGKAYKEAGNVLKTTEIMIKGGKGRQIEEAVNSYRKAVLALDDSIGTSVLRDGFSNDLDEESYKDLPLVSVFIKLQQFKIEIAATENYSCEILARRLGAYRKFSPNVKKH